MSQTFDITLYDACDNTITFTAGFDPNGNFFETSPEGTLETETIQATIDDTIVDGHAWRDIESYNVLPSFIRHVVMGTEGPAVFLDTTLRPRH